MVTVEGTPSQFGADIPPLGEMVKYDVEEHGRFQRAAELPHMTLRNHIEIKSLYGDLTKFAREYQERYDIEPYDDIPIDSLRIMEADAMREVIDLHYGTDDSSTMRGIYNARLDMVFARRPEAGIHSEKGAAELFYGLAHEVGHRVTSGLCFVNRPEDYSFALSEGLADKFASEFMSRVYIPLAAPRVDDRIRDIYAKRTVPYRVGYLALRPDEVTYIDPETEEANGLARFYEKRIVDTLEQKMGAAAYAELMRSTSTENSSYARDTIVRHMGEKAWSHLTDDRIKADPVKVLLALDRL